LSTARAAYEHDFARHAAFPEQFLCVSGLDEGKTLCNERLDLFLLKKTSVRATLLQAPEAHPDRRSD
jgi:hypothetical protein